MIEDLLADSVEQLLGDRCTPHKVREIEAGGSSAALWQEIQSSGFVDALLPESDGGAGLSLSDVFSIIEACGRHVVPLPLAQTMLLRAILNAEGIRVPDGPMTFARADSADGEFLVCRGVPYGTVADWVVADLGGACALLPTERAEKTPGASRSLEADLRWSRNAEASSAFTTSVKYDWRAIGASLFAAQMAGAMGKVFSITLQYANDRTQFGRSIGKFQAIQHQIAVMAEQASAARMAARIGCTSTTHLPNPLLAAVAKARTSEAAVTVASIGHAVHGAIGITEEFDLQLYTRRLHAWRSSAGSESYWNERIGTALLQSGDLALDFIRGKFDTAGA